MQWNYTKLYEQFNVSQQGMEGRLLLPVTLETGSTSAVQSYKDES